MLADDYVPEDDEFYDSNYDPSYTPNNGELSVAPDSFEWGIKYVDPNFASFLFAEASPTDEKMDMTNSSQSELTSMLSSSDNRTIDGVTPNNSAIDKTKDEEKGVAGQYLDSFKKFIFSDDGQKLALTMLAGGIGNMGKAKNDRKQTGIMQQNADTNRQNADTSRLIAQSNIDNDQRRFSNASSISKTNFGTAAPRGLIYRDLLTPRRQRNSGV